MLDVILELSWVLKQVADLKNSAGGAAGTILTSLM
jgi:hypothetical protein